MPRHESVFGNVELDVQKRAEKSQVGKAQVTPSPNVEPVLVRNSSCPWWGLKGFFDEEATHLQSRLLACFGRLLWNFRCGLYELSRKEAGHNLDTWTTQVPA